MRFFLLLALLVSALAFSQPASNYAGQQNREIKSMSVSEIEGYRAGKGMGLAKAAELNGYPGPKHVLDLSEQLHLTDEQIRQSNALFESMQKESIRWGVKLIDLERQLDQLFASGDVDRSRLKKMLSEIGAVKSQIRYAHLFAHIEQKKILTPDQIAMYTHHRGYGDTGHFNHQEHRH